MKRWIRRRWQSHRLQMELLCSGLVGFGIFCGLIFLMWIGRPYVCPFLALTGIPCPGCGMTRSFAAILRLDFAAAWRYNLLGIPLFFGLAVIALTAVSDVLWDRHGLDWGMRCIRRIPLWILITVAALLVLAAWVQHLCFGIG